MKSPHRPTFCLASFLNESVLPSSRSTYTVFRGTAGLLVRTAPGRSEQHWPTWCCSDEGLKTTGRSSERCPRRAGLSVKERVIHSVMSNSLRPRGGRNTPGLPVHHQLPDLAQTRVRPVSDAIQPSHPVSPSPPAFCLSQHQGLFQ